MEDDCSALAAVLIAYPTFREKLGAGLTESRSGSAVLNVLLRAGAAYDEFASTGDFLWRQVEQATARGGGEGRGLTARRELVRGLLAAREDVWAEAVERGPAGSRDVCMDVLREDLQKGAPRGAQRLDWLLERTSSWEELRSWRLQGLSRAGQSLASASRAHGALWVRLLAREAIVTDLWGPADAAEELEGHIPLWRNLQAFSEVALEELGREGVPEGLRGRQARCVWALLLALGGALQGEGEGDAMRIVEALTKSPPADFTHETLKNARLISRWFPASRTAKAGEPMERVVLGRAARWSWHTVPARLGDWLGEVRKEDADALLAEWLPRLGELSGKPGGQHLVQTCERLASRRGGGPVGASVEAAISGCVRSRSWSVVEGIRWAEKLMAPGTERSGLMAVIVQEGTSPERSGEVLGELSELLLTDAVSVSLKRDLLLGPREGERDGLSTASRGLQAAPWARALRASGVAACARAVPWRRLGHLPVMGATAAAEIGERWSEDPVAAARVIDELLRVDDEYLLGCLLAHRPEPAEEGEDLLEWLSREAPGLWDRLSSRSGSPWLTGFLAERTGSAA
jgi:hypothetical protein